MSWVPMQNLPPGALLKVVFRGRLMDNLTMWFLIEMEQQLGYPLTVAQGCYNMSVKASGTTHKGGGVVDLAAYKWQEKVRVGADLGGFPYHREELPGVWGEHVHMGVRNHPLLDPMAIAQQNDWDAKPARDGLAGHNPLVGQYHPDSLIQFDWKEATEPPMTDLDKMKDGLVQGIHSLQEAIAISKSDSLQKRAVVQAQVNKARAARKLAREALDALPPK